MCSCDDARDQLQIVKQELNAHNIALGIVNVNDAIDGGQKILVRSLFAMGNNEIISLQCDLACGGCRSVLQYNSANFQQAFTSLLNTFTANAVC